jgi:hypothetical protein
LCYFIYFKNFTYIPEKYYLSSNSKTIIESYLDVCEGSYNRNIFAKDFKTFLNKIKNTNFIINNYKIEGIKEGFPISSNLIKNNESYELEYGVDSIEMHIDALSEDDVVLIHDDLLATGGTMAAAYDLVKSMNPKKIYISFIVELSDLDGRKAFPEDVQVDSLIVY